MVSLYKVLHKTFMKSSVMPLSVYEFAEHIVCPTEGLHGRYLVSVDTLLQNMVDRDLKSKQIFQEDCEAKFPAVKICCCSC